jgi:hypothetical protein
MRRPVVAAVVTALLLAAAFPTAGATSTPPRRAGLVVGSVLFDRSDTTAVVRIYIGRSDKIASENVREGDSRFRFVLKPGRYYVAGTLTTDSVPVGCTYEKAVSVRAGRTIRVAFVAATIKTICHGYSALVGLADDAADDYGYQPSVGG